MGRVAREHALKVVYVDPHYSSHCPKCGKEMEEEGHRYSLVQVVMRTIVT
ncbi:zinc ribbon domain-containing protein [Metallosphaera tengchongensis]|nr:zinc ribbon domain-containing protein [Metallosphaera tengchongensis]